MHICKPQTLYYQSDMFNACSFPDTITLSAFMSSSNRKKLFVSVLPRPLFSHQIYDSMSYYTVLFLLSHKTETNFYSDVAMWILLHLARPLRNYWAAVFFLMVVYMTKSALKISKAKQWKRPLCNYLNTHTSIDYTSWVFYLLERPHISIPSPKWCSVLQNLSSKSSIGSWPVDVWIHWPGFTVLAVYWLVGQWLNMANKIKRSHLIYSLLLSLVYYPLCSFNIFLRPPPLANPRACG